MRRKINLVEVAARLLSMYIGCGSSKDVIEMFKCSKFSMKSVILFAHFLRTLIECSMSANRSMGEEQLCNDSDTVDSRYVKISDDMKTKVLSIISYLCPGKTITNRIMEKMVLNISEELFDSFNYPIPEGDDDVVAEDGREEHGLFPEHSSDLNDLDDEVIGF